MRIVNKYRITLASNRILFSGGYSGMYNEIYLENFHMTLAFIINKIKRK